MNAQLGLSLLSVQRTYLQSQQPTLNKHLFQNLVEHTKMDYTTLLQLEPTIPIYLKQLKRWSPRKEMYKPKRSLRSTSNDGSRTKRANSVCENKSLDQKQEPIVTHIQPLPCLIQKKQNMNSKVKMSNQKPILVPKCKSKQQYCDQMTLTPW
ncbi:unnamed protein product (macronuclear) [Paramecium tetraurelia]|uniref:Uncharacterized protein n=1 Tax=Paramecium tetraurelia TaxID=5888 RepID=A0BYB7_PARTE|nr:uncharacterized protein GSPATT00033387001 [Paramecium tetraurelia]CAK63534.1 unnamed protein product [Paramecium tetraurelia]|eukprot:XP_001430932.1 hypothetical protein (macronuclear) [Paramecium tetraurelia strain d4-2]